MLAPACAACAAVLDHPLEGPICGACWATVRPLPPPRCDACGGPLASWRAVDGPRCPACLAARPVVARTRAGGAYDGALRAAIHALKYDGRRSLAAPLAARMRAAGADVVAAATCAVPVPLHPWRRLRRGFNQAGLLARGLGPPVVGALARVRRTAPQAGLGARARRRNVAAAFAPAPWLPARGRRLVDGGVVLLVDDVRTTGATLDACARVLLGMGAREVTAVTAAWAAGDQASRSTTAA